MKNILLIGLGGVGGWFADILYKYIEYTNNDFAEKLEKFYISFIDFDIVEEKNLVRQNFVKADLGRFKSVVISNKYLSEELCASNYAFTKGISTEEQFEDMIVNDHKYPDAVICMVDNVHAKNIIDKICYKCNVPMIDCGNNEDNGQVIMPKGNLLDDPVLKNKYMAEEQKMTKILESQSEQISGASCADVSLQVTQILPTNYMNAWSAFQLALALLDISPFEDSESASKLKEIGFSILPSIQFLKD